MDPQAGLRFRSSPATTPYGASPYGASPYGASPYGASPYGASGSSAPWGSDLPISNHQRKSETPHWLKLLAAVGIAVFFITVVVCCMRSGSRVEHKPFIRKLELEEAAAKAVEAAKPRDDSLKWNFSKHSRAENVHHEEMVDDNGEELANDLKGLKKRAKKFFKLDQNKDAFLAGPDVPKGTLDLLDVDKDLALSFDEWTHGFDHVTQKDKLKAFQKHYGRVYGDLLPSHWNHRDLHTTNSGGKGNGKQLVDDREHVHGMDSEDFKVAFKKLDLNTNGVLSGSESAAAGLRNSEGSVPADVNKDGLVTEQEYINMQAELDREASRM